VTVSQLRKKTLTDEISERSMYYHAISNQACYPLVNGWNQGKRFFSSWTTVVLSILIVLLGISVSATEAEYKPGELIIQLFDDSDKETLTEQFKSQNLRPIKQLSRRMQI
jgi:hypothetical protein